MMKMHMKLRKMIIMLTGYKERQISTCQVRCTERGSKQNKLKLRQQEQVDSIKVLQETRDMVQALVSQLKGQAISDAGIRIQQENRGFTDGRRSVRCYRYREIGHITRDFPKKPSRPGDSNRNAKREEGLQQGQQQNSHLNQHRVALEACSDYNGHCQNVDQTENNVIKSIKVTQ